jgi:competence protein ComEA
MTWLPIRWNRLRFHLIGNALLKAPRPKGIFGPAGSSRTEYALVRPMRLAFLLIVSLVCAGSALAQTRLAPAGPPAASLIDLNSASRDELMTLDGIGEVRADAIIRARPFRAKTELVERRLIPEALYDKIADKVMARPPPGTPAPKPVPAQPKRS